MSNPEQQRQTADSSAVLPKQGAEAHSEPGLAASEAENDRQPAAGPSASQPAGAVSGTSLTLDAALALLCSTVATLEARGSSTYAARVGALMKRANPDFAARELGFASFHRFVSAAVDRNLVTVHREPRASDFTIHLVKSPARTEAAAPRGHLLGSVWSALGDWEQTDPYWWNPDARTVAPPSATSPAQDGTWVALPAIGKEERIEWAREFIRSIPDPTRRESLTTALAQGLSAFQAELRGNQATARRWSRLFRARIVAAADEWARTNAIEPDSIYIGHGSTSPPSSHLGSTPSRRTEESTGTHGASEFSNRPQEDVRQQILSAVGQMSFAELLRLPIPAEYLLRR